MAVVSDLGECKLLRSNCNYLRQCLLKGDRYSLNPQVHELLWTDGNSVWLLPMKIDLDCNNSLAPSRSESLLLGEFNSIVVGTACSSLAVIKQEDEEDIEGHFIAVILKEKVSILFRQVGECVVQLVNEHFIECSPQGYKWHPTLSLLAIASRTSALLLKFSAVSTCDVVPLQTYSRFLNALAWSTCGKHLAISAQKNLLIFTWKDLHQLNNFTCNNWSSLGFNGKITSVVPWQSTSFIIATELPLDILCSEKQHDVFEVDNLPVHCHIEYEVLPDNYAESSKDDLSSTDVISLNVTPQQPSPCNSLINFKLKNSGFQGSFSVAQLVLVSYNEEKPKEITRTAIENVVSPDLLLFLPFSGTVVVGSHSCSRIHCYSLHPSQSGSKVEFKKVKEINLSTGKKPKGMCTIPGQNTNFLILLGNPVDTTDDAFPPSGHFQQYQTELGRFSTITDYTNDKVDTRSKVKEFESSLQPVVQEINVAGENAVSTDCLSSLRLPDGSVFQESDNSMENERICLISEERSTEESVIGGQSKAVVNTRNHSENADTVLEHMRDLQEALRQFECSTIKMLSMLDSKVNEICSERDARLQQCSYPRLDNAEFVCIVWTDELTGAVEQENFLLDKGRLSVKTIQNAFRASLLRIRVGDVPCIVSAGEDGFIPVKFLSGSTVHMSGHSLNQ